MNYPKASITEIRKYIEGLGGTLVKEKRLLLNGQIVYRVTRDDGSSTLYTVDSLNESYQLGEIA